MTDRFANKRDVKAPTGTELNCLSWTTEAPFRMLHNNLDREVAENPDELVVYGGIGRAARSWADFDAIAETLKPCAKTRPCSYNRANLWASLKPTRMRRAS